MPERIIDMERSTNFNEYVNVMNDAWLTDDQMEQLFKNMRIPIGQIYEESQINIATSFKKTFIVCNGYHFITYLYKYSKYYLLDSYSDIKREIDADTMIAHIKDILSRSGTGAYIIYPSHASSSHASSSHASSSHASSSHASSSHASSSHTSSSHASSSHASSSHASSSHASSSHASSSHILHVINEMLDNYTTIEELYTIRIVSIPYLDNITVRKIVNNVDRFLIRLQQQQIKDDEKLARSIQSNDDANLARTLQSNEDRHLARRLARSVE
jgi:hypothetical protein